jgi:hypothetical protein
MKRETSNPTSGQLGPKSPPPKGKGKFRQESAAAKPSDRLRREDEPPSGTSGQHGPKSDGKGKADKQAAKEARRMDKSKSRVKKTAGKLTAAQEKLAAQKPPKRPGLLRTVSHATGHEVWATVHGKIHEVERDNVGVEAAHRAELLGERAGRATSRFVKHRNRTRPIRRVRKWEHKNVKANADLRFRQMAQEHPELKDGAVKRYLQKRRLRKQFQKQAKEAAKKTAQKTGEAAVSAVEKVGRAAVNLVKRHPTGVLIALLCFLLIFIMHSCMGMMATIGSGLSGAMGASTYPSEDREILAAEAAYAGMEADLQYELDNYSRLHPGYDEYHFDLDEIEHDPYVLISILSAWHEGAWTLGEVQGTLGMLFEKQYILTENVVTERRYYIETDTWTDADGNTHSESYRVYYDYYICTVTLENFNLSHLPVYIMGEDKLSRYALFMATLGNRPDLFPSSAYIGKYITNRPTDYDVPEEYLADETFAAILTEAEKYLGYPYVWGGYNPSTSFDCSGFVSWVLNHSGWDVGRLSAQGLYNICTRTASPRPGDLVFFVGTYDTPGVSRVGIYVGDGVMLHCGDPINYANLNTSYWQSHFYAYGRLP